MGLYGPEGELQRYTRAGKRLHEAVNKLRGPTDAEVEAVALAAWLSMTRDDEGPQEWWDEDMWDEWNAPLRQWNEMPGLCTHIGADGFRRAARAAIIALDEVRASNDTARS